MISTVNIYFGVKDKKKSRWYRIEKDGAVVADSETPLKERNHYIEECYKAMWDAMTEYDQIQNRSDHVVFFTSCKYIYLHFKQVMIPLEPAAEIGKRCLKHIKKYPFHFFTAVR